MHRMNGSDSAAQRPQQLIVTVFGLYSRSHGEGIAVAHLIKLLGDCGVESSALRSSVSRLKKQGLLQASRRRSGAYYSPSKKMLELLDEGDARIYNPPRAELSDGWLLATFSVPESRRNLRHRIRSTFTKWGAGTVTPGVWIAPGHNESRIRAELSNDGLSEYVDFFAATYLGDDFAGQVAKWWDLAALGALYQQFEEHWRPMLDCTEPSSAEAFASFVTLMTEWRRLPYLDPGLPLELLPTPWPAQSAADLLASLHERFAPLALNHYEDTING